MKIEYKFAQQNNLKVESNYQLLVDDCRQRSNSKCDL